jgi:hypothetical protein
MGERTTKLCDYTNVPNDLFIAKPITSLEIKVDSFEVIPRLLGYLTLSLQNNLMEVLMKTHLCIYMIVF